MKNALWFILKLAVTVGLLAYLMWRIPLHSVAEIVSGASWGWIGAGFVLYLAIQGLCAWRWLWLARVLNLDGTWTAFVRYYYIGMFFNLFLPTGIGGDVYRCYYLVRSAAGWRRAIISVLADRGVGFATMCAIAMVGTIAFGEVRLPTWLSWAFGAGAVGMVALLAVGFLARGPLAKIKEVMPVIFEFFQRPGILVMVAGVSVLLQSLVIVVNIFNSRALHLDIPVVFFFILIPLISVASMIPVSLNGLGVREGAFVFFLAQVGIAEAQALSLALLWLAVLVGSSLIGGAVWLLTPTPQMPQTSLTEAESSG